MFISFCWFSSFPFVFWGSTRKWNARERKKKVRTEKCQRANILKGWFLLDNWFWFQKNPQTLKVHFCFFVFLAISKSNFFVLLCLSPPPALQNSNYMSVLSFNRHRTVIIITWSRESMETHALKTRIFFVIWNVFRSVQIPSVILSPFYFPLFSIRLCERGGSL